MNPPSPIDQNLIPIYSGNASIIKARLEKFLNARPMLRKWTLPNYVRLSGFPEYEAHMKLIFHDAQIYDVVIGRALRTVPDPAEPVLVTNCRKIYDEANFQAYSLIVRTFTTANSGFVDASGSIENDGQLLWTKLVRFNYGTSDDGLPYLKAAFYDRLRFNQKEDVSLDHWAAEVRQASSILSSSGHPISEAVGIMPMHAQILVHIESSRTNACAATLSATLLCQPSDLTQPMVRSSQTGPLV